MQYYFPLPEVVPPTEQRVFPQALRTALLNSTSSEHALETLYAVWGYQASVLEQFCQTQADAVLCVKSSRAIGHRCKLTNCPLYSL